MKEDSNTSNASPAALAGYSRAQLLTWLGGGTKVSTGWDAYLFTSRTKTNRLLVQEYVSRIGQSLYIPSVTDKTALTTSSYQFLRDFTLGNPLLSFENANLDLPLARLTMPFVRGAYLEVAYPDSRNQRFETYSRVVPLASPRLRMELSLLQAPGSVSSTRKVELDVSEGRDFEVDYVAGSTKQAIAGQFFKDRFAAIKQSNPGILKLPLGEIDVSGGGALIPKAFSLRTMAAPGATQRDASDYGDGAVVVLINTTNTTPGGSPGGELQYLIPNDTDDQGQLRYSAMLLIKQKSIWSQSVKQMLEQQLGGGLQLNDEIPNKLVATAGNLVFAGGRVTDVTHGTMFWYIDVPQTALPWSRTPVADSLTVTSSTGESLMLAWKSSASASVAVRWDDIISPGGGGSFSTNIHLSCDVAARFVPTLRANGSGVSFDVVVERADVTLRFDRSEVPTVMANSWFRGRITDGITRAIQGISLPGVSTLALQSLLFNGNNTIDLLSAHLPADLALFGDVSPSRTSFEIIPDGAGAVYAKDGQYFVGVGGTQKFSIFPVRDDLTWSVATVPGDGGQPGTIADGLFTAPTRGQLGGPSARTIITARTGTMSSQIVVHTLAAPIAIEPLVAMVASNQALPKVFSAQSMAGRELDWSIVGGLPNTRLGEVEGSSDREFIPSLSDEPPLTQPQLILHEVRVQERNNAQVNASAFVLVSYGTLAYTVIPDLNVHGLAAGQTQLVAKRPGIPDEGIVFEILQGPGHITRDGLYTEDPAAEQSYVLIAARLLVTREGWEEYDTWNEGYNIFPLPFSANLDIWEQPNTLSQDSLAALTFGPGPAKPAQAPSTGDAEPAANDRDQLLQQMQGRSVTHGWSAVSICNRTRINRLLEQQYISKLNGNGFMPSMRGTVYVNTSGTETMELSAIILGTPRLSFENASLTSSRARLTMDIMSGTVAHIGRLAGATPRLYSTLDIAPAQGYQLYMDIDLLEAQGGIDEQGRVTLDLARGTSFSTNLIGNAGMAAKLGEFFQEKFERQPPQSRIYELGLLDMVPVERFSPADFRVRTQPAPDALRAGTDSYGDGAVVLFIRTQGDEFNGEMPTTMPYWIPDDVGADGGSKYSATLLVSNRALLHWPLADYLEQTIPGLLMSRIKAPIGDLNLVFAAQGSLRAGGILLSWQNPGETNFHSFSSDGALTMPLAGALPSQSLNFTTGADGLLYLNWQTHFVQRYNHTFIKNGTGGGIDDWYDVTVAANLRMGFKAEIDSQTGDVGFVRQSLSNEPVVTLEGSFDQLTADEVLSRLRPQIAQRIETVFERQKITLPSINTLALQNILFPEGHAMKLDEAWTPGDLVMFGNVNPDLTRATVSPQFHLMRSGSTQQFSLQTDLQGATDITWSCHSLDVARAQGVIDPATGVYTAMAARLLEGKATRTVITALFTDGQGQRRSVSGLVTEVAEGTQVAQGVIEKEMHSTAPIALRAGTLGDGALTWRLLDRQLGTLTVSGNEALYTPPALQDEPFTVQRIEVRNAAENETSVCSVVLLNHSATIEVKPMYRTSVGPGRQVQLTVDRAPYLERRWSLLAGEGSVDSEGLFTAPASVQGSHAVVQCQVMKINGDLDYEGYSVLQVTPYVQLSPWETINTFTVKPLIGAPILYRNGYQQLPVEISITTDPVNGEPSPPSPGDLLSVRLVYEDTTEVGIITQPGLEDPEQRGMWAVRGMPNGYEYYQASSNSDTEDAESQARSRLIQDRVLKGWRRVDDNTRSIIVYLHSTAPLKRTFGGMILQDELIPLYSKNYGGVADDSLMEVQTDLLPPQPNENYEVVATRVRGDGKCEYPDYDMYLDTLDYHNVQLRGSATHVIHFKDVKFESFFTQGGGLEPGGTSVQWESNNVEERVASFLGYLLPGQADTSFNESFMTSSQMYKEASRFVPASPGNRPTTGSLTVVMARVNNLAHGTYAGNEVQLLLHEFNRRPLHARVRDVNGNLHRLRISFATPENRNEIKIEVDNPTVYSRWTGARRGLS
jgi:hypothetical protein